jgi:MFS family permease
VRRILAVTAGLAAAGAVVGGMLGGVLASLLELIDRFASWNPTVFLVGAEFGAIVGFVLAPIAAWTLMRRVPLWRAITETAIGTTVGAGIGLLLQPGFRIIALSPLLLGVVGFAAAALRLRLFYRERASRSVARPDDKATSLLE